MKRSLPLIPLLLLLMNIQLLAQEYIPYKSYLTSNGVWGQPTVRYQLVDNYLFSGTSRFTVTSETSSTTNSPALLFDGSYESLAVTVPAGETGKITVDFTGRGLGSIAYPGGKVYVHFYYTGVPLSVTGRAQKNDETWYDITDWSNISTFPNYAVWRGTTPGNWNYLKKLEFTITAKPGAQAVVAEIEYVPDRPSNEFGVLTKFAPNSLYKTMTWRDTAHALTAQITETGNGYFKGNVGINTWNPTTNLHVTGSSIITGNAKLGSLTVTAGAGAGKVLTSDATGNATWQTPAAGGSGWGQGGTTVGAVKLLGTIDNFDLPIITNNVERMRISSNGNVGIGINNIGTDYKLYVSGNIRARKVRVDQQNWPDYVFSRNYQLMPLSELEQFIANNQHLPDMPSAKEVSKEGLDVGSNQAALLKKIEELTLYIIEQNKRIEALEKAAKAGK
ncbi:hypothetical protein HHL16_21285 [Pseudoflavitalea sp. G-6-1-2]|uniref:hypothetical protein n=1 Tax=Pseudoflavitalea sp. G-6-1-2 TaxID=2728841 RepID=UPI00146E7CBA|nr:hypothetical protein [Pseudoflavitalea sp. G-6-1-2]NML23427.1 hypothetical protein [Pseudoflavitalea sp. G-6-1-2]